MGRLHKVADVQSTTMEKAMAKMELGEREHANKLQMMLKPLDKSMLRCWTGSLERMTTSEKQRYGIRSWTSSLERMTTSEKTELWNQVADPGDLQQLPPGKSWHRNL
ncbi:hypothetical protein NDU88_007570 [Pleurodeles waltl]|uniref:Uncharacterized protein n=1 Tax=Pleurodeles waltl TaxID=8319 RepID=A0AAV7N5R7_PLEWA|nr:hypothetical protein NDU88_007570 [Pleurodeles waltl]